MLFVDTSQDFSAGHVPGSKWVSRSWLEIEIPDAAPGRDASIAVTCGNGRNSILAAAALAGMGYTNALRHWRAAWPRGGRPACPSSRDLTGIVRPPADINYLGVDRSYGEMMNYLRWETELGVKYAVNG